MSTIEDKNLDAALDAAPGADPELSALVRDVRAEAPTMSPHFGARLEDKVAALPKQGRAPRLRGALAPRRLVPVFAACAVLAVMITAGLKLDNGSDDEAALSGGGSGSGGVAAVSTEDDSSAGGSAASSGSEASPADTADQRQRLRSATKGAPSAHSAAPEVRPFSRDARPSARSFRRGNAFSLSGPRKVQRDADLTLTTAPGDVQDVADEVVSTTQDVDGVVARSSVNVGGGGGAASFVLRIPTRRLDDALKRLSDLAHVGALKQGSTDITGSFVSATERLSDARAERRALLKALGKATTPNAISSLRQRIRFNRSEIGALKGELQAVKRRADLATVSVRIKGSGAAKGADEEGGAWTPADAARDALRVLEVAAGVILIAAAVLLPIGILALLTALAARLVRRRSREQALDAA